MTPRSGFLAVGLLGLVGALYAASDGLRVIAGAGTLPTSSSPGAEPSLTAWPILPGSERDLGRELPVRVSSPRGALRLSGIEAGVAVELEPLRELGVPFIIQPDFTGERQGVPFAEFYGLDAGPRRARAFSSDGRSRLLNFTVRAGEITSISPGVLDHQGCYTLSLLEPDGLIDHPASLHVLGADQDSLRRWEGARLELSAGWGVPDQIGVRFRNAPGAAMVRAGGRFTPRLEGDTLSVELPGGDRSLEVRWSKDPAVAAGESHTIEFARYGKIAESALQLDLVREEEFELPPFSYTHLQIETPQDGIRLTHLADTVQRLGVGFSGAFEVRLWRRTEGQRLDLREPALVALLSGAIGESEGPEVEHEQTELDHEHAEERPLSPTRAVLAGPWRRPAQAGGEQLWGRVGFASTWIPGEPEAAADGGADQLRLEWAQCARLLGLDPVELGIEQLHVRSLLNGTDASLTPEAPALLQVPAEPLIEISGLAAGVRVWGWFDAQEVELAADNFEVLESRPDAPRIRLQDADGSALHSLQIESCRIEWLRERPVLLDFTVLRPTRAAAVGGRSGSPEAFRVALREGDVLVIHNE